MSIPSGKFLDQRFIYMKFSLFFTPCVRIYRYIIDFFLKNLRKLSENFRSKQKMEPATISKVLSILEVLFPTLLHFFNVSILEIIINGDIFLPLDSDFASILFTLSVAMICQAIRKRKSNELSEMPVQMIGVVMTDFLTNDLDVPQKLFFYYFLQMLLNSLTCDLFLRLSYIPFQYLLYFIIVKGYLVS